MRKNYLVISIICLAIVIFTCSAYSAGFSAITADDEVESIEAVQVKETKAVDTTYTLGQLDSIITTIQARIDRDTSFLNKYQALRTAVEVEAKKIKLKVVPTEAEK